MNALRYIAVYCGSSFGNAEDYKDGAIALGKELARRNITLVYGGSSVGLMGVIADTVLSEGGEVIGVIPNLLEEREIAHTGLTKLFKVKDMHERKAKMAELADGFIAMPGGPGTLEEFFEIFTWAQIGLHQKPFGLLNVNHYYEPIRTLFNHMVTEGFMKERYRSIAFIDANPNRLLDQFDTYTAPAIRTYDAK